MAQNPLSMDVIKQVLRLHQEGVGIREMARRLGISRNSVKKYLNRLGDAPASCSEQEVAEQAYQNDDLAHDEARMQDLLRHFEQCDTERSKTGVTRQLLWQEYLQVHPDGYSYSRYCHHLQHYLKNRDLAMHLSYTPGDMVMIDFAGKKLCYTDVTTGELIACEVFVAILPFSGLIFALPVASQQSADFAQATSALLRYCGGVPATILCDNLKTAVTRSCRYEPVFTDLCGQLSAYYGTTFSATRPYSPRDKALVEGAVHIVYNHIYGPLRQHTFCSLEELRRAVAERLEVLNDKGYRKTPFSRRYYFATQEAAALQPLPAEDFILRHVVQLTVQRNYHIQLTEDRRYYSVPYVYVGRKVKVYYDQQHVEVYADGERIALHRRQRHRGAYVTEAAHMPPHHQRMQLVRGWSRQELLAQAQQIGPSTQRAAELMLQNSIYIEQNYKACYGMLMLAKKYTPQRLEAACLRVIQGLRVNYTLIKNVLERGLDRVIPEQIPGLIPDHDNIRGPEAYQ